ncbi:MAG: winged helix DNA-binding protein [Eubacterium sp.]|nr:winged helix DNA-binding protein [Eubacterium sp.]
MDYNELYESKTVDFSDIPAPFFLLGLLSAFDNSYQATADAFFSEISWKQVFAIVCIDMCREAPTLRELSQVMGSSHQNVKQILLKLEKKGFVEMRMDEKDRRKQRIFLTQKAREFSASHDAQSQQIVSRIFAGIPEEELDVTIQTILHMERNLKTL